MPAGAAGRPWRLALLAVLAAASVFAAWRIVAYAMADLYADADPERALQMA